MLYALADLDYCYRHGVVHVDTDQEDCAKLLDRYDQITLPVVDDVDYTTLNGTWYSLYTQRNGNDVQSVSLRIDVIDDAHLQLDLAYSV